MLKNSLPMQPKNRTEKSVIYINWVNGFFRSFKILVFFYLIYKTANAESDIKFIYKSLSLPFAFYFLINVLINFLEKKYGFLLLGIELILNIVFILYFGNNHVLFQIMTLISIILLKVKFTKSLKVSYFQLVTRQYCRCMAHMVMCLLPKVVRC